MIEVIKDNTKQKFFTLCETCLSELSYEHEDVEINNLVVLFEYHKEH